jgi:hypothetical protein
VSIGKNEITLTDMESYGIKLFQTNWNLCYYLPFILLSILSCYNYKSQNSDSIKKIKCNNINTNLNGLNFNSDQDSLTSNDLTGLATGGVEDESNSKESVNANSFGNGFDKNKDIEFFRNNLNNNEGGTSPQNPSQILSSNLYLVEGEEVTANAGDGLVSSIAECENGDTVLEGGMTIAESSVDPPPTIQVDGPLPDPANLVAFSGPDNSAYGVALINVVPQTFTTFSAYAYCFDNSP